MNITKGRLRQIIREELDAMVTLLKQKVPRSRHTRQSARSSVMAGVPVDKVQDIIDSILDDDAVDAGLYDAMIDANSGVRSRGVRMEEGGSEPSDDNDA